MKPFVFFILLLLSLWISLVSPGKFIAASVLRLLKSGGEIAVEFHPCPIGAKTQQSCRALLVLYTGKEIWIRTPDRNSKVLRLTPDKAPPFELV